MQRQVLRFGILDFRLKNWGMNDDIRVWRLPKVAFFLETGMW